MPCSIRDDYEIFRNSILTANAGPEDEKAREALESDEYFDMLQKYDEHLSDLTGKIWENEYLDVQ